ncbi:hypothetical protein RD792_003118 [Penstemon davidsonii]|uniref:Protein kinase domain-containing protein n=1 Tax=Penstemon davidsonii TaxID=160366 RepID=A0ABR0DSW6_9LAMI|nr:hypothetical protein RD792_003118 [Penstemon davidsonii]
MVIAVPGQLNFSELPVWGSRSVDCFEKLEMIGEGAFGQVYMAKETETGEIVALKKIRIDKGREGFPSKAIREIKILQKLDHENVIKLKEVIISTDPEKHEPGQPDDNKYKGGIFMVLEYMDHDLTGLAARAGNKFSVPQIKCYMRQLLTGLHYCHVNEVLHRDLKGSNLLVDNKGNLKLADFGLARFSPVKRNADLTNNVITLWYRPPELLLGTTKYDKAVDMWSVGCIFGELLNGTPIFAAKDEMKQLHKIFDICGTPTEANWPGVTQLPLYNQLNLKELVNGCLRQHFKHFDQHALDLLDRMLNLVPYLRISANDALDAYYFRTDPLPCDPNSLPRYESSHEYQTKKRNQQQRQLEESSKRQKLQHQQQPGHSHTQMRPGPNPPVYRKSGWPSVPPAGYNYVNIQPNRGQGGGGPYPPQGHALPPPYCMPGAAGPRGGPNYPHAGGAWGAGRGGGGHNSGPYPPQGHALPPPPPPYGMPGAAGPRGGPNYPHAGGASGSGRGQGGGGPYPPQGHALPPLPPPYGMPGAAGPRGGLNYPHAGGASGAGRGQGGGGPYPPQGHALPPPPPYGMPGAAGPRGGPNYPHAGGASGAARGQSGGGPYPPQGHAPPPPYGMPGVAGPRGRPNYPHAGGASGTGRGGSNLNRNQQYYNRQQ